MNRIYLAAITVMAAVCLALTVSCTHSNLWTVDGKIDGAEGQTLILEASSNGRWYPLDSLTLATNGKFRFSREAVGYPDIFRLRLNDKVIYFPIDSIETVSVISHADAFDTDYDVAGTPTAERMMQVDNRMMETVNRIGVTAAAEDSLLKRDLATLLLTAPSDIVSYYIINKRVGGKPLFDPANKRDLSVIGAVANAFVQLRPGDPRTEYLQQLYLTHFGQRLRANGTLPRDTVVAGEIGMFDISLYDENGNTRSLNQLVEDGKTVLLNFTAYSTESSPAFNVELNRIYNKYRDRGLEIYQVSIDEDEYQWRQTARNLPWVTVWNSPAINGNTHLLRYNVQSIPVCFVITPEGEITRRIEDMTQLDQSLSPFI